MNPPDQFEERQRFSGEYESYNREVLEPTRREIRTVLAEWNDRQYWAKYADPADAVAPSPLARTRVRVKRLESAEDKILRKPEDFPDGLVRRSLERMGDAVAARAVVYFVSQLTIIDDELRDHPSFEHHPEVRPVAYLPVDLHERLGLALDRKEKVSGYASLHYSLRLRESTVSVAERPWFEFQVRTLAEDVWGEIEHFLGYKPEKKTTLMVRQQFRILGRHLHTIDEHFDLIAQELARQQRELKEIEDPDVLNPEVLPRALQELRIPCAQKDIDGLLKILASRGISSVGALRDLVDQDALTAIRETWRLSAGEEATNFDIVSTLVSALGTKGKSNWVTAARVQIAIKESSGNQRRDQNS